MYKLCYFVPASHLEQTKQAIFETGAGRIGDYDSCAWQTRGEGQFRPLSGSQPYIGREGAIEKVDEYKVELVCSDDVIRHAISALKQAHPYEEPAYDVFKVEMFE